MKTDIAHKGGRIENFPRANIHGTFPINDRFGSTSIEMMSVEMEDDESEYGLEDFSEKVLPSRIMEHSVTTINGKKFDGSICNFLKKRRR